MFDYTHLLFTLLLTQPSIAIGVLELKKNADNASKIIEVNANMEKAAKKKKKNEKKFHRSKMIALVNGHKKELLNHKVESKQVE